MEGPDSPKSGGGALVRDKPGFIAPLCQGGNPGIQGTDTEGALIQDHSGY